VSLQFFLRVDQTSRLLVRREGLTLHTMDYTRSNIMKATHVVALFAALLLTATEFLVMDYDVRQRAVQYQAEAASALTARE
jgi:hypothetical protein